MSERFEKLYQLPLNLYSNSSPVIISAAALLKDYQTGKIIVQLKFQSVTDKIIKAIKVKISAFDIAYNELQGIDNYQYLDLNIYNGQYFGSDKAIIMPDTVTRSFGIDAFTVYFDDNTEASFINPFIQLPECTLLSVVESNFQLQRQYKLAVNDHAIYIPQEHLDLWQCSCGEWNRNPYCSRCKAQKEVVFSSYDISSLTDKMEQRLALEKAEAEAAAERKRIEEEKQRIEAEQQEKLRQERMQKYIKLIRKISIPVVCILFVTMVFTQWLYPNIVVPALAYMEANQLLNNGQYEEAKSAFNALGEYKDSPEKVEDIIELMSVLKYNKAIDLAQNGSYADAIEIFEELGDYEASIEWLDYVRLEKLKADGNPYVNISPDLFDTRFKEYLTYLDIPYSQTGFSKDSAKGPFQTIYALGYASFLGTEYFVEIAYPSSLPTRLSMFPDVNLTELKNKLTTAGCSIIEQDKTSIKAIIPDYEIEIIVSDVGKYADSIYIQKTSKLTTKTPSAKPNTKPSEESTKTESSNSGGSSGSGAFYVGGQKVSQPSHTQTAALSQPTNNKPSIDYIGKLLSEKLKFQVDGENTDEGGYLYRITVKNKSEYTLEYFNFHFDLKDKSGKTLDSTYLGNSKKLKAGGTMEFEYYSDYMCPNYTCRSDYGVDYDIQW